MLFNIQLFEYILSIIYKLQNRDNMREKIPCRNKFLLLDIRKPLCRRLSPFKLKHLDAGCEMPTGTNPPEVPKTRESAAGCRVGLP